MPVYENKLIFIIGTVVVTGGLHSSIAFQVLVCLNLLFQILYDAILMVRRYTQNPRSPYQNSIYQDPWSDRFTSSMKRLAALFSPSCKNTHVANKVLIEGNGKKINRVNWNERNIFMIIFSCRQRSLAGISIPM